MRAFLMLLVLALGLAAAVRSPKPAPDFIIVCESGGVHRSESHLGSGWNCVLHDKEGSATSAAAISIYDDSNSPGP